jgi:predicted phage-related endonuclease
MEVLDMARPTKPVALVSGHRTKDELAARREAEAAMLTGVPMKMQFQKKWHKIAAKEFERIKKLLATIGKDDALYEQIINTHCLLVEECQQIEDIRNQFIRSKEELQADYQAGRTGNPESDGISAAEYYRLLVKLSQSIMSCDKQLMAKRKMLLDIDKENVMTVQSALRSIPKKPEKKQKTGMAAFMEHRAGGG